jgi:signal transduction histidine kinase
LKRLYLRIYFAVLATLVVLALAAGFLWSRFEEYGPSGRMRESIATLVANALPPADAPSAAHQAALEKLLSGVSADVTLYATNGERLAVMGTVLPLPAAERMQGSPGRRVFTVDEPPARVVRLADGRWVVARVSFGRPLRGARAVSPWMRYGVLPVLALLALAIGIGAYPVVRRLTRRLERLQTGVEALGAGALSTRVAVEGNDEVARLAESFNRAATRIEELIGAHKTLLANASHELRTPLARIRMGVEFLKSGADAARSRDLERDIAELDAMIEEILLASRLDAVPQTDTAEAVDLLALAAEECARYTTATLDGEPVTIQGDARLLRRLIRNLLENAYRHGAPPVEVKVRARERVAEISVCDHGTGVPDGERERVFEPFYRYATRSDTAGAGLGLALVRQIARRHGGEAYAEGNCFRVVLRR